MSGHGDDIPTLPGDNAPTAPQAWRKGVLCGRCLYEITGIVESTRCPECGTVNVRGGHPGSHCTQFRYVALALTLGWLGVHNFAARRLLIGAIQLAVFLSSVALVLAGLSSRFFPFQQFSIALLMLGGLCFWALMDALLVTRDGKRRPMPAARRRKR